MGVEIAWSTTTAFDQTSAAVSEPVQSSLVSEVSPSVPVGSYHHLYITNVGDVDALECGFYIAPAGGGDDPTSFRDLATILSWTLTTGGLSEYGVYTVQGTTELVDFLNAAGGNYLTSYSEGTEQHTYTNGTTISNRITLKDADGAGDELHPSATSVTGSVELYLLIKIPDNTGAGAYDFDYVFYYEEQV